MFIHGVLQSVRTGQRCGRVSAWALALLVTLAGSFAFATPAVHAAAPTAFYVESTGHTLGGDLLQYWIDQDGQTRLGDPVTEPQVTSERTLQYFQYGVLVRQPDGEISREKAAETLLTLQENPTLTPRRELDSAPTPGVLTLIEPIRSLSALGSGHPYPVDASIREFYQSRGGQAALGRALAPATKTGSSVRQWFEFARIDVNAGGVALAPIGLELATSLHVETGRAPRGDLPAFDPDRYTKFRGDGTIPEAAGAFVPSRILIPAIAVDAAIEPVGVVGGVMQVPVDEWNVGWYSSMASPGEWSNVVMAGHKDWWGVGPVVFWNLDKLVAGDRIYVIGANGSGATYEVTLSWQIDADSPADPLIGDTGFEALTLITCDGQWNGSEYTSRRIIRAKRI